MFHDHWLEKFFSCFPMRLAGEISEALFPRKCMSCGQCFRHRRDKEHFQNSAKDKTLDYGFSQLMAPFFCRSCRDGFQTVEEPVCTVCGILFESRNGINHVCKKCGQKRPSYDKARAAGIYEGPLLWAVRKLKYHQEVGVALPLGKILQESFRRWWPQSSVDMVIPVPLHPKKMRQRGFNQTFIMIKEWGKRDMGALNESGPLPSIDLKALVRIRYTKPQAALSREERRKNLLGAFTVPDPDRIRHRNILLVDDVMTSGETVDICAKTLLKAGAARVDVLTLARAL